MDFKNPLTENINPAKVAADYKGDLLRAVPTIDVAFVGKLISDVFGVQSPVYLPTWWQGREFEPPAYPGIVVADEQPEYDKAPIRLGNKTFGAFWLKGGKYKKFDEYTGALKDGMMPDFLMPLATLVDFSRPKEIIKTPVLGGAGSVKEMYGLGDWAISIRGIIIPDENNPVSFRTVEGQMEMIQMFHELAGSIEVDGQIFAKRRITNIVTESLSFSPVQGRPNMMQYSIEAISDSDFLLTDVR